METNKWEGKEIPHIGASPPCGPARPIAPEGGRREMGFTATALCGGCRGSAIYPQGHDVLVAQADFTDGLPLMRQPRSAPLPPTGAVMNSKGQDRFLASQVMGALLGSVEMTVPLDPHPSDALWGALPR